LTNYGNKILPIFHSVKFSVLSPVSTGMGDYLQMGIPAWYVTRLTRTTQPCILLGSLNRVPALIGWGKGRNVTSAVWHLTVCDPIWHMSSHIGEACCKLLYSLTLPYHSSDSTPSCLRTWRSYHHYWSV